MSRDLPRFANLRNGGNLPPKRWPIFTYAALVCLGVAAALVWRMI